jgi:uncharacterized glyoxalase superfamily protein PhnB
MKKLTPLLVAVVGLAGCGNPDFASSNSPVSTGTWVSAQSVTAKQVTDYLTVHAKSKLNITQEPDGSLWSGKFYEWKDPDGETWFCSKSWSK